MMAAKLARLSYSVKTDEIAASEEAELVIHHEHDVEVLAIFNQNCLVHSSFETKDAPRDNTVSFSPSHQAMLVPRPPPPRSQPCTHH